MHSKTDKLKKAAVIFMLAVLFTSVMPLTAQANMARPSDPDVGSSITFEKNGEISVLSEVLDIRLHGPKADITAAYKMKNTSGGSVSTPSMFISPDIESSGARVTVNGADIPFEAESYTLTYNTEIETTDWKYAVLKDENDSDDGSGRKVDCVTFMLDFAPDAVLDVTVSYTYCLGGYPDYDFDAKRGEIYYYLAPAAMWNGFENLTINLYLDRDMPVITRSNLEFEKIGTRTYQYVSSTLPEENLDIVIDENWFQNIFSTLRSPYFLMTLMMALPLILTVAVVIVVVTVIFVCVRKKKKKKEKEKEKAQ